jgi:hypothetical protein
MAGLNFNLLDQLTFYGAYHSNKWNQASLLLLRHLSGFSLRTSSLVWYSSCHFLVNSPLNPCLLRLSVPESWTLLCAAVNTLFLCTSHCVVCWCMASQQRPLGVSTSWSASSGSHNSAIMAQQRVRKGVSCWGKGVPGVCGQEQRLH